MKIKINEKESYEIQLNQQSVSIKELSEIISKLTKIKQLAETSNIEEKIKQAVKETFKPLEKKSHHKKVNPNLQGGRPTTIYMLNRNVAVKVFKLHLLGTIQEQKKYASNIGFDWYRLTNAMHQMKEKWNITAEELGVPSLKKSEVKAWLAKRKQEEIPIPVPEEMSEQKQEQTEKTEPKQEQTEQEKSIANFNNL